MASEGEQERCVYLVIIMSLAVEQVHVLLHSDGRLQEGDLAFIRDE